LELTLNDGGSRVEILNETPSLFELALDLLGFARWRRLAFGQGQASIFAVSLHCGWMSGRELGNACSSSGELAPDLLALGRRLLDGLPAFAGECLSVQGSPPFPCGLASAEAGSAFAWR
jgi:hypothetical protein